MAKYLLRVSYTAEGAKGVMKEGGSARQEAAGKALASVGGSIDAFYFTFGDADVIVIADLPDHVSAAALSMTVSASGGASVSTTPLISPDEIDEAAKMHAEYRPPAG
jgi:uncharacterized protein with GYD domain